MVGVWNNNSVVMLVNEERSVINLKGMIRIHKILSEKKEQMYFV